MALDDLINEDKFKQVWNAVLDRNPDGFYLVIGTNYPLSADAFPGYKQQPVRFGETRHIFYFTRNDKLEDLVTTYNKLDAKTYFKALIQKTGTEKKDVAPKEPVKPKSDSLIASSKMKIMKSGVFPAAKPNQEITPQMFLQDIMSYLTKQGVGDGYYFGALYKGEAKTILLTPEQQEAMGQELEAGKGYSFRLQYADTPRDMFAIFEKVRDVNDFIKCYIKVVNGIPEQTAPRKIQNEIGDKEPPRQGLRR